MAGLDRNMMALTWFLGCVVEGILAGLIVGAIVRD
jgi:hypothetical protein